ARLSGRGGRDNGRGRCGLCRVPGGAAAPPTAAGCHAVGVRGRGVQRRGGGFDQRRAELGGNTGAPRSRVAHSSRTTARVLIRCSESWPVARTKMSATRNRRLRI